MPFINVKTTQTLAPEKKNELKADLGKAIAIFPGKTETWLMCNIEDGQKMYFQGSDEACAFVEVKLLGSVSDTASNSFTAEMCKVMDRYGVSPDRVYVRYEGGNLWGWNGSNF